jgi:hypothetical protein
MDSKDDLRSLVATISEALRERDRLVFDEEIPHELGSPCSRDQIRALEKRFRAPLPPSYRAFLELHNGWDKFQGGAKLLAVEDHGREWVAQKKQFWSNLWEPSRSGEDPFEVGMIPVLFGEDTNSFLVVDPRTVRNNGEMDFIMYDNMREERRFEDFTSFLAHKRRLLQQQIDDETKGIEEEDDDE